MPQLAVPLLVAATVVGVGLSAYSTISQSQTNSKIAEDQQRQEALRQQAMELDAKRRRLEALRQQQRARAMALSTATAQGGQFGSGLAGGYGQIQGGTDRTLLGISQGLELGRQNFGLNSELYGLKSDLATEQGLGSLGGSIIASLGTLNNVYGYGAGKLTGSESSRAIY